MPAALTIDCEQIAAFYRRNHIRRLSLFGSVLRRDFGPESDVDTLVEFEPQKVPGIYASPGWKLNYPTWSGALWT